MGVTNQTADSRNFYKLKEDKRDGSPSKGEMRFFRKERDAAGKWAETETFTRVEGYLEKAEIKEYQFEGATKKELVLSFQDNQPGGAPFSVMLGLDTMVAKNILNSLADIETPGVISLTAGRVKLYKGREYPTLYVNNNGEKTNWRYTSNDIPPIVYEDIEGQTIRRGVAENLKFWTAVAAEISARIYGNAPAPQSEPQPAPQRWQQGGNTPGGPNYRSQHAAATPPNYAQKGQQASFEAQGPAGGTLPQWPQSAPANEPQPAQMGAGVAPWEGPDDLPF